MDTSPRLAPEPRPVTVAEPAGTDDWPEASADEALFGPCRRCGEPGFAGRTSCPECGYDLAVHDRRRLVYGALGTAMALSGLFAPLGLPLLWRANRHRRLAGGDVTAADDTPLGEHLRGVLGEHLSLGSPGEA